MTFYDRKGKLLFKKKAFKGGRRFNNPVAQKLREVESDTPKGHRALKKKTDHIAVFKKLEDFGTHGRGLTEFELKMALSELKYDHNDPLSAKEVDKLAKKLGVKVTKKTYRSAKNYKGRISYGDSILAPEKSKNNEKPKNHFIEQADAKRAYERTHRGRHKEATQNKTTRAGSRIIRRSGAAPKSGMELASNPLESSRYRGKTHSINMGDRHTRSMQKQQSASVRLMSRTHTSLKHGATPRAPRFKN